MRKLILASASPRRREILEKFGYNFDIIISGADESQAALSGRSPAYVAKSLARLKGLSVLDKCPENSVVLSADSIVVLDNEIIGKPESRENAFEILSKLSGRVHTVYTGVCIIEKGRPPGPLFVSRSKVSIGPISPKEIEAYINTGEPMDKAGAYSVQGLSGLFVEKLSGDFYGIMGLPVRRTYLELKKLGIYPSGF